MTPGLMLMAIELKDHQGLMSVIYIITHNKKHYHFNFPLLKFLRLLMSKATELVSFEFYKYKIHHKTTVQRVYTNMNKHQ